MNNEEASLRNDVRETPSNTANRAANTTITNQRLGIFQLGIHAHEKTAPSKSLQLMTIDTAIRIPHIIPILAKASEKDHSRKVTYLCHPSVQYITKEQSEGSFCGYRNIQMLISHVLGSGSTEHAKKCTDAFADGIPSILQIQELIETAWDMGINSSGRIETGGIRGTRKHIGTPEAQALFKSLGISCAVGSFTRAASGVDDRSAFCLLLDYVENHFTPRSTSNSGQKVCVTDAPPIYLQRPHHSLTIVGIQLRANGTRHLLVLNPAARPSRTLLRAAEALSNGVTTDELVSLKEFRQGRWNLGLYREFETLSLQA